MTRPPLPHLELHIDELVLHGEAGHGDGRALRAALERELGQLLAARGLALPAGDIRIDRLDAGRLEPGSGGQAVAQLVHGAIERATRGGG